MALSAGLVAVAFQLAMNGCYRAGIVRLSHCSLTTFLWGSLGSDFGDFAHFRLAAQLVLHGCRRQRHPAIKGGVLEEFRFCALPRPVGEIHRGHAANRRRQQSGPRRSERAIGGHGQFAAGGRGRGTQTKAPAGRRHRCRRRSGRRLQHAAGRGRPSCSKN